MTEFDSHELLLPPPERELEIEVTDPDTHSSKMGLRTTFTSLTW